MLIPHPRENIYQRLTPEKREGISPKELWQAWTQGDLALTPWHWPLKAIDIIIQSIDVIQLRYLA
jgi:hypothetical protein